MQSAPQKEEITGGHKIEISDNIKWPRCELWLEFVFDYNMEYADAFNPQVKSVDVLVFDSDDKLLFTKSAEVAALVGGSRMSLTDELDFGSYKVLTVGSLSDRFRLSDNVVNFEFQHLYFGEVVEVDHPAIQYQP